MIRQLLIKTTELKLLITTRDSFNQVVRVYCFHFITTKRFLGYAEHVLIRQTVYLRVLFLVVSNTCNVRQDNTLFSLSNISEVFTTNTHRDFTLRIHSREKKRTFIST